MTDPSRDRRITGVLAIGLFAYYLMILGGHHYSMDGIVIFQSAKQLLFQHSLALAPPVRWERDIPVSIYGIGMTLAYLPLLAIWWPLFDRWPDLKAIPYDPALAHNPALYANLPYLLCSVLNPIITAATGCLVFRMARLLGLGPAWALVAAGTYGLASPAAPYARYDFSQPLTGLALTAAAWGLLRAQRRGRLTTWTASGTCLACGVLTRPEVLALAPWMAAWAWWQERDRDARAVALRVAAFLAPVVLAGGAYIWISWLKFGTVGKLGYAPARLYMVSPAHLLEGLAGLLVSPTRGLLVFFPLSALAVFGLRQLGKGSPGAASLFAGMLGVSLLLYSAFRVWWGGVSWGPRFLVPLLPIVALAATAWAARTGPPASRARQASFAVLALLGFLVSVNGILSDFVEHHRWVTQTLGLPATGPVNFRLAASPLVTGWLGPPTASLDLFWLRLLDVSQVRAYSGLLSSGRPWIGDNLPLYAALAGATVSLLLLAVLVAAGHRLWKLAQEMPSSQSLLPRGRCVP